MLSLKERSQMSINQISEQCQGSCKACKAAKACKDIKKDQPESKTITLTVKECQELLKENDFWRREAIRQAAELGEKKISLAKFIEENK